MAAAMALVAVLISLDAFGTSHGMQDLARRWQGAWVVRDADYPGSIQAWSVRGDRVSVYDAVRRDTVRERFALVSPCRLQRTLVLAHGSEDTSRDTFVFADDGLHVARAPASGGSRVGELVTACIGEHVYRYWANSQRCLQWDAAMTGPPVTPNAECAIVSDGVTTSFVVRPLEGGSSLHVDLYGQALLSDPLLAHVAERSPDFDAAKARADRLRAPSGKAAPAGSPRP